MGYRVQTYNCISSLLYIVINSNNWFWKKGLVKNYAHMQHNNFSSGCNVLIGWLAEKIFEERCLRSNVKIRYISIHLTLFYENCVITQSFIFWEMQSQNCSDVRIQIEERALVFNILYQQKICRMYDKFLIFTRVLNSAVALFCNNSREYKNANNFFLDVNPFS